MESVRSGLRLVGSVAAHAGVAVGGGSLAAVSTVLPSTGGAIDLIVVRQPDGNLRCSPFYVRFGKYQGLIRGREKVVTVTVNGVLSDFTMQLGRSGEAFFVESVDTEAVAAGNGEVAGDLAGEILAEDGEDVEAGFEGYETEEGCLSGRVLHDRHLGALLNVASPASGNSDCDPDYDPRVMYPASSTSAANADSHPQGSAASKEEGDVDARTGQGECGGNDWDKGLCEKEIRGKGVVSSGQVKGDAANLTLDELRELAEEESLAREVTLDDLHEVAAILNERRYSSEGRPTEEAAAAAEEEPEAMRDAAKGEKNTWGWFKRRVNGDGAATQGTPDMSRATNSAASAPSSVASMSNDDEGGARAKVAIRVSESHRMFSSAAKSEIASDVGLSDGGYHFEADVSNGRPHGASSGDDSAPMVEGAEAGLGPGSLGLQGDDAIEEMNGGGFEVASMLFGGSTGCAGLLLPRLELSLCGGNLAAFDDHRVDMTVFANDPAAIASHPALAARPWRPPGQLPSPPLPWAAAVPHLLGHLAFGTPLPASWQLLSVPVQPTSTGRAGPVGTPPEGNGGGFGTVNFEHHSTGNTFGIGAGGNGIVGDHPLTYGFALSGADSLAASEPGSPTAQSHHSRRLANGSHGSPLSSYNGTASSHSAKRKLRKRITLSSEEVARLGLRSGKNVITFSFSSRVWGRQEVQAHAYVWDWNAKVVVSDVDGTITKSDVLGHLAPMVGKDWNHAGVAQLYNSIRDNGYELMFLSSRAISQSKGTRRYLEKLTQDGETLSQGPVMLAPDPMATALYREVVVRRPQEFKMRCLQTIRDLFPADWNPFYAGFGNRETDTVSYASVGVPPGRNFTINPRSEVVAETTKTNKTYTLGEINELVDEMFPPVSTSGWAVQASPRGMSPVNGFGNGVRGTRTGAPGVGTSGVVGMVTSDTFADANYWRREIPVLDDLELP